MCSTDSSGVACCSGCCGAASAAAPAAAVRARPAGIMVRPRCALNPYALNELSRSRKGEARLSNAFKWKASRA